MKTFKFKHCGCAHVGLFRLGKYGNGRLAVRLYEKTELGLEPYATLSVNPGDDEVVGAGEFVMKIYSENAGLFDDLYARGLVVQAAHPPRYVTIGITDCPVLRLTDKAREHSEEL